jgi:hypothetical protein
MPEYEETAQNLGEAVPAIMKGLKLSTAKYRVSLQYPLLQPTSLNSVMGTIGGKITAKTGYTNHSLAVHALGLNLKHLFTCDAKCPSIDQCQFANEAITVDLRALTNAVSFLLFSVSADTPFSEEIKTDVNLNLNLIPGVLPFELQLKPLAKAAPPPPKPQMTVLLNGSIELLKCPCKLSSSKSGMLWFILARDAFCGWTMVNLRIGISTAPKDILSTFQSVARTVLKA